MSNLAGLHLQRKAIDEQIAAETAAAFDRTYAAALASFDENGINLGEVAERFHLEHQKRSRKAKGTGQKVEPKYRHTPTGATWAGRGMPPAWMTDESNVETLR